MNKFVFGLVTALVLTSPVLGQCYSGSYKIPYSTHPYTSYVKPKVNIVKDYIYQAVIPVFQIEVRKYDSFGAVYTPPIPVDPASATANPTARPGTAQPAATANTAASASDLNRILDFLVKQDDRIKKIEDRLDTITSKVPKVVQPKDAPKEEAKGKQPTAKQVVTRACAACHDAKNAEEHGGEDKFQILDKDGEIIQMTNEQLLACSQHIYAGTMPLQNTRAKELKIEPLNDTEVAVLMKMIAEQRKKNIFIRKQREQMLTSIRKH